VSRITLGTAPDSSKRIGYLHLRQVNPVIVDKVLDKDLSFFEAVRMGAMIQPPLGAADLPLPIAKRTKACLSSRSGATIDFGGTR
jgi:hypothetical protein